MHYLYRAQEGQYFLNGYIIGVVDDIGLLNKTASVSITVASQEDKVARNQLKRKIDFGWNPIRDVV